MIDTKTRSIGFMEPLLRAWGALPPRWIRRGAKWGGLFWHALDRRHRRVAEANIRLALGYTCEKEIRALARANFMHLLQVFLEVPRITGINASNFRQFVEPEGKQFLEESLELGKGVLLLTGHFGNWEWMAHCKPFFLSRHMHVVVRPVRPPALNRMVSYLRQRSGNRLIDKKNAVKPILHALEQNEMVGILLDQHSTRAEGVYAPFFNGYVLTNRGLALLAIKSGAPVHPVFNWREPSGKYRIEIQSALHLSSGNSLQERVQRATALFNGCIEKQIRRYPSQWYWIHQRFKRRLSDLDEMSAKWKFIPKTNGGTKTLKDPGS